MAHSGTGGGLLGFPRMSRDLSPKRFTLVLAAVLAVGREVLGRATHKEDRAERPGQDGAVTIRAKGPDSGPVMSESTSKTILRNVQDILWANLPLEDGLPDAATIYMLRAILQLPLVRTAIDGDDIAANFVLRSMRTILADETLPPCKLLSRLWQLEAETNGILGTATTSD